MTQTQSKAVAKKQKTQLPAEVANSAWGAEDANTENVLIPKLLLMQGLSQAVSDEKASMGDFVDSTTLEVLGTGREKGYKPVRFIPIKCFETWVVYEKLGGEKLQFKEIVPFGGENAKWERETETYRRDRVLNFYVLLEEQANNPAALPYTLAFRRTSFVAGKKLSTHFTQCKLAATRGKGRPPAATIFELSATKRENDHGTFYVWDVAPAGETKPEHLQVAYEWFQTLKNEADKYTVDNSEYAEEAGGTVNEESEF